MTAHHSWGTTSLTRRASAHPLLQKFLDEILIASPFDLTILEVYRGEVSQERAFDTGTTHVHFPDSLHNQADWATKNDLMRRRHLDEDLIARMPVNKQTNRYAINVRAVDVVPVEPRWEDYGFWCALTGLFRGVASGLGIEIVSGLDWDRDWNYSETGLKDGPHWQLAQ